MDTIKDEEIIKLAKRMRQGPLTMKPVELTCRLYGIEYIEGSPAILLEGEEIDKALISCLITHYVQQNYGLATGIRGKTQEEKRQYLSLYQRVLNVLQEKK